MFNYYLIMIFIGFFLLYYHIEKLFLIKQINKKFLFLDESFPQSKEMKKVSFFDTIKEMFLNYFKSIYLPSLGFKIKNLIILLMIISIIFFINEFFLKLPIFISIFIGITWGIYIINLIEFKIISNEFEETFPKALVILNGAVSSGSNIIQGLDDCSKSLDGTIANEFKTIVKGLNLGEEPSKVFANSYKRLPFKSYYFFLMALLVSIKSGARLKEILSRLSIATTKAKAMEKKKDSMTSEARMSSKITAAIPFVFLFLMKFISPENFDYVLYNEEGRYILYYFLGSEIIGMLIIAFLMRKI